MANSVIADDASELSSFSTLGVNHEPSEKGFLDSLAVNSFTGEV
jgi:hypothetical protein